MVGETVAGVVEVRRGYRRTTGGCFGVKGWLGTHSSGKGGYLSIALIWFLKWCYCECFIFIYSSSTKWLSYNVLTVSWNILICLRKKMYSGIGNELFFLFFSFQWYLSRWSWISESVTQHWDTFLVPGRGIHLAHEWACSWGRRWL